MTDKPEHEPNEFEKVAAAAEEVGEALADKAAEVGEALEEKVHSLEKLTPKELGDLAVKFATDTAYAAAGFANLIAEKAREFTDKQKVALVQATNPAESAERTKELLDQFTAQVNKFVEEVGHTYKELADRGREAVAKVQAQAAARAEAPKGDDKPGPFDIIDDADAAEATGEIPDAEGAAAPPVEEAPTRDWGESNR
nr:hypothetical protein [Propionibacterium sp.]